MKQPALALTVAFLAGCVGQGYEIRDAKDPIALSFNEIQGIAEATSEACCVGENSGALITREQSGEVKVLLRKAFAATATAKFHAIDSGEADESKLAESARLARAAADLLENWGVDDE